MWFTIAFALMALMEASAFIIENRQTSQREPRVVRNTIRKRERAHRSIRQRQNDVVESTIENAGSYYYLDISIGTSTQPQTFIVDIDTGSSDLWVNSYYGNVCNADYSCDGYGGYNGNISSTYSFAGNDFNISYTDGTEITGDYAADVVRFGDVALDAQEFGLSYYTYTNTGAFGVMGIGYQLNEAIARYDPSAVYDNVPLGLLNQGHVSSLVYSIWLNDLSSSEGELLFGGINRAKYEGGLTTIPVIPDSGDQDPALTGRFVRLQVALTSVALRGQSYPGTDTVVTLDTGSTYSRLPNSITDGLFASLNVTEHSNGHFYVACDLAESTDTLDFAFGSAIISVPFDELVLPSAESDENCHFGMEPTNGRYILGDTFLRSAYVVYDLHNNEISLAQTIFDATLDDIVEVVDNESVSNIDSDGTGTTTSTSSMSPTSTTSSTSAATSQSSSSTTSSLTTFSTSTTSLTSMISSTSAATSQSSTSTSSPPTSSSTSFVPLPTTTPLSTEPCSQSTVVPSSDTTSSSASIPYPTGDASCPFNGVVVCGPTPESFGLCNFGRVIWQPVSDGTNCIDGKIVGTGIYAVPEVTAA